jgi:hypothetical protein
MIEHEGALGVREALDKLVSEYSSPLRNKSSHGKASWYAVRNGLGDFKDEVIDSATYAKRYEQEVGWVHFIEGAQFHKEHGDNVYYVVVANGRTVTLALFTTPESLNKLDRVVKRYGDKARQWEAEIAIMRVHED